MSILQRMVPGESPEDLRRWNSTHYEERKAELRERKRERVDTLAGVAHVPKAVAKTPLPMKEVEVSGTVVIGYKVTHPDVVKGFSNCFLSDFQLALAYAYT